VPRLILALVMLCYQVFAPFLTLMLPWLRSRRRQSIRYRGTTYKAWLALFVVSFLVLGYLGSCR